MITCNSCGHAWYLHHDGLCTWRGGIEDEDFCLCDKEEETKE